MMVIRMIFTMHSLRFMCSIFPQSMSLKKSVYLLSVLLIMGCQPPSPTEALSGENSEPIDMPIIRADSITITPEHILSVKPTRYQPSLGLQGRIEPIKKINLVATQSLIVEQVLVSENQWVKKGTPLLIVRRQALFQKPINPEHSTNEENGRLDTTESNTTDADDDHAVNSENTNEALANDIESDSPATKASSTPSTINDDSKGQTTSLVSDKPSNISDEPITLRASFSGRVENLSAQIGQEIEAQTPFLKLSDERELHFTSTLPIEAESQISVGQTVNFTAEDRVDKFTGQVSKVQPIKQPIQLLVYVNVVNNEVSRNQIVPGMQVTGRVDYGQIEVGTIVPKNALHNVDLTQVQKPPYKPLRPLSANIWIIGQDQRLTLQPIEIIEYNPLTQQYLIAGITNDSLICLANLPAESKGKKVVVS